MASVASICNQAIIAVGGTPITSIDDSNSKEARLCKQLYERLRDQELRKHSWNFAVKRAVLAPLASAVEFGFSYQFQLPVDFIRLLEVMDDVEYQKEGVGFLANTSALKVRYIYRVTDPNQFDDLFSEALSAKLAMHLVYPLEGKVTALQEAKKAYAEALREARFVDATEGDLEEIDASEWELARL